MKEKDLLDRIDKIAKSKINPHDAGNKRSYQSGKKFSHDGGNYIYFGHVMDRYVADDPERRQAIEKLSQEKTATYLGVAHDLMKYGIEKGSVQAA